MNPLLKYHEQLARVQHMEALCNQLQEALASDDEAFPRLLALQDEVHELIAYYEGPQWLEDFNAERQGLFPKDLPRGILAEDTLYDLLCDIDVVMNVQGNKGK